MDKRKHIKFSIQLFVFTIIFFLILYCKISKLSAVSFFLIMFSVSCFALFNKKFNNIFYTFLKTIISFIAAKLAIIALLITYIIAIIPTKIMMVLVKRDRLKICKTTEQTTYWQDCNKDKTDYELQY